MTWTLVTAPVSEPLTTTEAKNHLRVDISDDDILIDNLVEAARQYFEEATGRSLFTQTWRLSLDCWPANDEIVLPRAAPLASVTHVKYFDSTGAETTWDTANYAVDTYSEPGRVVLGNNKSWPTATLRADNPIQVEYVTGWADVADIPQRYRQAILLVVGHWYENREDAVIGLMVSRLPLAVTALININRVWS